MVDGLKADLNRSLSVFDLSVGLEPVHRYRPTP